MLREIVLDTETTGLDPEAGHRIVEIACIELVNHIATGRRFQVYLNPEREMTAAAFGVHGLSDSFLAEQKRFGEVVDEFLEFIGEAPLVIHNAEFDMKFVNAELGRLGFPPLPMARATDTVGMARRKYPGAPASLDALCKRFAIDNSARTLHGALLDAELLSEVYLELLGGRQARMELGAAAAAAIGLGLVRPQRPPRPHAPTADELVAHAAMVAKLKDPIWVR